MNLNLTDLIDNQNITTLKIPAIIKYCFISLLSSDNSYLPLSNSQNMLSYKRER